MLEAVKPKYQAALQKAKKDSTATHKKGVGIAIGTYGCGLDGPDGSAAFVELNRDNSITVGSSWEDHGQGADAGAVGVAHEALRPLQIEASRLRFTWPDMAKTPNSGPAGGSRSQVMTGSAIKAACEAMVEGLKKPGGGCLSYEEAIKAGKPTRYDGAYSVPGVPCDEKGLGKPFMVYMYGVFLSEITVEVASGKTVVDKITMMADVGKINNRLVVDGQLYGGIAQSTGYALSEDFDDIQKHATLLGAGLPYIKDIPDNIELVYFEEEREYGPFGAAGCGELPLTAPHASILNAIHQATGARVTRLPARPDVVLEAIKAVKK
jgi:aldehyde oxidoreductase